MDPKNTQDSSWLKNLSVLIKNLKPLVWNLVLLMVGLYLISMTFYLFINVASFLIGIMLVWIAFHELGFFRFASDGAAIQRIIYFFRSK